MDQLLRNAIHTYEECTTPEEQQLAKKMITLRKEQLVQLKHSYTISQNVKTLYWSTYVASSDKGRKLIRKKSHDTLIDALYIHYYPAPITTTIAELYPQWLEHKSITVNRSTTLYRIDKYWVKYYINDSVSQKFIHKDIALLTRIDLLEWMCYLVKQYKMKRKEYTNMSIIPRAIFKYAFDLNMIPRNEFNTITIPSSLFERDIKKESETQVFTKTEQHNLCTAALTQYRVDHAHNIFLLSIPFVFLTGLRLGEIIALAWDDIKDDHIYVHQSLMRDVVLTDDGWLPCSYSVHNNLKKNAQPRKIYLTHDAQRLLDVIRSHYHELGAFPTYVFEKDGKLASEGSLDAMWKRLCNKIGILPRSPHKGRKTFITTLLDSTLSSDYVRQISGHENENTTRRHYHYNTDDNYAIQEKMNLALTNTL